MHFLLSLLLNLTPLPEELFRLHLFGLYSKDEFKIGEKKVSEVRN